jgi:hypothetical protein
MALALPIVTLRITGLGYVDLSGAGTYPGGVGTVSYILPVMDGGALLILFARNSPGSAYRFLAWAGDGTAVGPACSLLAEFDSTYTLEAVFEPTDGPGVTGLVCPGQAIVRGAPAEPTSESVRIAARRECAAQQALPIPTAEPCRAPSPTRRRFTTLGERDRLLREISRCSFYRRNPHTGALCPDQRATAHDVSRNISSSSGGSLEVTRPHSIHQYRTHPRLRGIDDITVLVRSPSAGELTARRRTAIETAARNAVRHSEHYRTQVPPPPCRVPNTRPQPGVPIRPGTIPCNPGTLRVDYSNPLAR